MHTCPRCHVEKPDDHFRTRSRDGSRPTGWCRACRSAISMEWVKAHPERRRAITQRYWKTHSEQSLARQQAYRDANKGLVTHVPAEKRCSLCHEVKPASEFSSTPYTRSGLDSRCKPCNVAKATAWNKANPDRYRANQRRARLNSGNTKGNNERER